MKHAAGFIAYSRRKTEPKHKKEWTREQRVYDYRRDVPYFPGRHAKPFAKRHPATPVTYDAAGTTTPLVTSGHWLDVVA